MAETQPNLWTPWRMEYIKGLAGSADEGGCFLCHYRDAPADDAANFVLWRSAATLAVLNRFPYTNGHVLLAPTAHVADLDEIADDVLGELALRTRDAQRVLKSALQPHGFNIGVNIGRCAGAGLPGHIHYHIVPRWNGDTNFMSVVGDARVIPQELTAVRDAFLAEARRLGIGH